MFVQSQATWLKSRLKKKKKKDALLSCSLFKCFNLTAHLE